METIGEAATLRLVNARGGTRVIVPATEAGCRRSYLKTMIGPDALRQLSRSHGGVILKVPAVRAWRAAVMLERGGKSHAEIAVQVGLTESRVQRLATTGYSPMPTTHAGTRRPPDEKSDQLPLPL